MEAETLNRAIEMEQLRLAHTGMIPLGSLCTESARRKGLDLSTIEYPFFIGYKDHPAPSHTQLLADEMIISVRMPCRNFAAPAFTIDAKAETIGKAIRLLDQCVASAQTPYIHYHDALEYAVQPAHKNLRRLLVRGPLENFMDALARGNAYERDGLSLAEMLVCEKSRLVPLLTVRDLGRAISRLGQDVAALRESEAALLWKPNNWIENAACNISPEDELPGRVRLRRASVAGIPALRLVQPPHPTARAKHA